MVTKQDLGTLGPAQGEPIPTSCPLRDSLRGAILWLVLLVLLLRKPNRTGQAWAVLLPLAAIYLTLALAEIQFSRHRLFYTTLHSCAMLCDSLRALAVAMAVLLALSDRITLRNRLLRWLVVFAILFAAGAVFLRPNTPAAGNTAVWTAIFGFYLLVFLIGHALLHALLRWLSGRRELVWSMGVALVIGLGPVLALPIIVRIVIHVSLLLSTWAAFRLNMVRVEAITSPYFVLFWFLLLARLVPFYRRRLAQCFGYDAPAAEEALGTATGTLTP